MAISEWMFVVGIVLSFMIGYRCGKMDSEG